MSFFYKKLQNSNDTQTRKKLQTSIVKKITDICFKRDTNNVLEDTKTTAFYLLPADEKTKL